LEKAKTTEEEITWAYTVLKNLKQGIDTAIVQKELGNQLWVEFFQKLPTIMKAIMILVEPEHRGVVMDVMNSALKLAEGQQ